MAVIRVSSKALGHGLNSTLFNSGSNGFGDTQTKVRIFKGALPTKADLDATAASSLRTSDRLITFLSTEFDWTIDESFFYQFSTNDAVAEASGTAAWFLLSTNDGTPSAYAKCAGEVSIPGGGGDLVIPSLTITAGLIYTFGAIKMSIPRNYS